MAPEQVAGERSIDHRADLYALGIIAYELLTGNIPFVRATRQALMTAQLTERPAPIVARRPETPAPLNTLVLQLLAKRAEDRPASATEVLTRLDAISPTTTQAPSFSRAGRWARTLFNSVTPE